ncbi:MAG: bifunctional 2-polyprenyl-6-hydroxyphenol methylase/3-demethylubiquinol 3-O-methyltransferase UbiG [Xanthomonadales bacterium]|nr:bifunctional 2-polyprenyl-6-hydroxyphenol methylase/3-demethylubiquinol 3-O-methyltransferase UbiG [Xanthomonadales bacterium]
MSTPDPASRDWADTASVDPREVAHYDRLADTWWDQDGPFWPLHTLNASRVPFIAEQVCLHHGRDSGAQLPLQGLKVLDIGCGGGILAESMAQLGASVHGIDVAERNILVATSHAQKSGISVKYECTTAEALAQHSPLYDIVLNMEVVEHVADLEGFMVAATNMVRPGGQMFVATINRNWIAWLVAIFGAEYVLGWLPRGTHRYDRLRKPREIMRLLEIQGLSVSRMTGVQVNPVSRSMSLTGSTLINYMMSAHKRPDPRLSSALRALPWEDRA